VCVCEYVHRWFFTTVITSANSTVRRACNICSRRFSRRCKRVKLLLEVMTLDVATPFTLLFDGDAAIFTIVTAVEFSLEVSRGDACQYMRRGWRTCS
jgi:hypothetical protein